MVVYKLEVTTGADLLADTYDNVYVTLLGAEGDSERTSLVNSAFKVGKTRSYTVTSEKSLGNLLLVKLETEQFLLLPEKQWFCSKVAVTTPEADVIIFPCDRWVSRREPVELRTAKATRIFEDQLPLLLNHRKREVEHHKELYQMGCMTDIFLDRWLMLADGLPHLNSNSEATTLPAEAQISFSKNVQVAFTKGIISIELQMKSFETSTEQWKNFDEMKKVFWFNRTPTSEYVSEHWKEDDFYGYQFLNGPNPNVIQRCLNLPSNFPVTEEMVRPSLGEGSSLAEEMQKGSVFLCNYEMLENLPTRVVNGEPLFLPAPLCLLYKNREDNLIPIAIQLAQQPSGHNPIFLPSDSDNDWLLAKMFVRNADFIEHQFRYHLLNTHFLAEVFAVATLRNFPVTHPIYKLLIPHFRHTLFINLTIREGLFGPKGTSTYETSLGVEGITELMRRSHAGTTYSSLCLPDNIAARGLGSIPKFYYRDDGLKLWNIINSFVKALVKYYYTSDDEVIRDSELQEWIKEIFTHGFLAKSSSGIPERFVRVDEIIQFLTMTIFTASVQHAAVNKGQFDYSGCVTNNPSMLRKSPPTTKGSSTLDTILKTLPNVGATAVTTALLWQKSKRYSDFVPLGTYPDEHFEDAHPRQLMKQFQIDLKYLAAVITERNQDLKLPYNYLNPGEIENSVAI